MKYGIYVPNCWAYGSVGALTQLARTAEDAGWEGFFVWDHLFVADEIPLVDAQVATAAIAGATSPDGLRRIGALVTPLARRRPWKFARETAALQEISEGRLVVGVGLGRPPEYDFSNRELATSPQRGAALDDGVELLREFWKGKPVRWRRPAHRRHVDAEVPAVDAPPFLPVPDPPPPVWVAGVIQYDEPGAARAAEPTGDGTARLERTVRQPRRPFRRAASCEGLFPVRMPWDNAFPLSVPDLARALRLAFPDSSPPEGYDVVVAGRVNGPAAPTERAALDAYEELGATWWLESPPDLATLDEARAIIEAGPPRR